MSKKDNINERGIDRDVRPQQGQQSNENWDQNNDRSSGTSRGSGARRMDEETNTTGVGSNQRNKADNVGPLESDLEQLPSEKRRDRGTNQTGPGLG